MSFTPHSLRLSKETIEAVGPLYLVSSLLLAGKWKHICLTTSRVGQSEINHS